MDLTALANRFIESNTLSQESVGTFKEDTVETGYRFYHVIQRTYCGRNLFTPSSAAYYHNNVFKQCPQHHVTPICAVVMPSHTHEIFYCDDVRDISSVRKAACRASTVQIKADLRSKDYSVPSRIFDRKPGYVAIKNRRQLLITLKYIKDNDQYLQTKNSKAPYSCFEYWEKDFFRHYCLEMLESLFGITKAELIELLRKDKSEVLKFADRFNTEKYKKEDYSIFRI